MILQFSSNAFYKQNRLRRFPNLDFNAIARVIKTHQLAIVYSHLLILLYQTIPFQTYAFSVNGIHRNKYAYILLAIYRIHLKLKKFMLFSFVSHEGNFVDVCTNRNYMQIGKMFFLCTHLFSFYNT